MNFDQILPWPILSFFVIYRVIVFLKCFYKSFLHTCFIFREIYGKMTSTLNTDFWSLSDYKTELGIEFPKLLGKLDSKTAKISKCD